MQTPLDLAFGFFDLNDAARLRFYGRLAEAELFVLLEREPEGDAIAPQVFDTEDGRFLVCFDLEERLAEFAEGPAAFASMSGRALVAMIADQDLGQGLGLGLNLGVAPSSTLLPPDAVRWLAEFTSQAPEEIEATPTEFTAPALPEPMVQALDSKLSTALGLAKLAYLAGVRYDNDSQGHILAFVDPAPGAEPALAQAVSEALAFSGEEDGQIDVAFFETSDPLTATLAKTGLRFDLEPVRSEPVAPGRDPEKPPVLK